MIRLVLKLALASFALIAALMMLILARTAGSDSQLWTPLMPENCAMPCFMGIQPGVTTVEDAIQTLQTSGWVKDMDIPPQSVSQVVNELIWRWNDSFPYLPDADHIVPYGNFVTLHGDVVESIVVGTSISLADFNLAWGKPAGYLVRDLPKGTLYYAYEYPERQVRVIGVLMCPYFPGFWSNGTNIVLGDARQNFQTPLDRTNDGLFLKQLVQFGYRSCGR